jgi:hypothetical protein
MAWMVHWVDISSHASVRSIDIPICQDDATKLDPATTISWFFRMLVKAELLFANQTHNIAKRNIRVQESHSLPQL